MTSPLSLIESIRAELGQHNAAIIQRLHEQRDAPIRRRLATLVEQAEADFDDRCEACGRPLYDGVDEWDVCPARDADGLTSSSICSDCIDAAEDWLNEYVLPTLGRS